MTDGQTGGRADGQARLPAWVPWVVPFGAYMVLHGLMPQDALTPALNQLVRIVLIGGILLLISRPVIDLRVKVPLQSILIGVGVFVIWIGPDLLFPGYRQSVPLQQRHHWKPGELVPGRRRGPTPRPSRCVPCGRRC